MQTLRERGIYALSGGKEFVAHAVFRGGYVFYTLEDWNLFGSHKFEYNGNGKIRWKGQPDQGRSEDPIDTNRTAPPRARNQSCLRVESQ